MRLCVPIPFFYPDRPVPDAIREVGRLGYDAVEIYGWKGLDLPAIHAACEESGVEMLSMCTSEFRMTSPEHRALPAPTCD